VRPLQQHEQRWNDADRRGETNRVNQGDGISAPDSIVRPTSGSTNISA
jgi:hypothetical protein